MENTPKPRRVETPSERTARLAEMDPKALAQAMSDEDELDAMVRRSIEEHGV